MTDKIEKEREMTCEVCGKQSKDVCYREDSYARDVGGQSDAFHTVCDECDQQNTDDI